MLAIICGIIIFGGLRSIARVAEFVVPIMAIAYLILAFWVMSNNIERLPDVFLLIIKHAFGLQEAVGGVVGYGIAQAMTQGIPARPIFK